MQGPFGTGKSNQQSPDNSNNKVTMRFKQGPQRLSQHYMPVLPIGHASARTNNLLSQFTLHPP
jgi:hypothetical protein